MANNSGGAAAHRRRIVAIGVAFIILAAGGLYWYRVPRPEPQRVAPPPGRPAVPVSVAVAARQDVPIYVTGLGIAQGSFTIAIHSQVDGVMQEVKFTEGHHVRKGDVLARIEPRLSRPRSTKPRRRSLRTWRHSGLPKRTLSAP